MIYDLIIIGGGPAGTAAGVYAARKQLDTLLFAEKIGGQSDVSPGIQNWIGSVEISGTDLAASFKKHLEAYRETFLQIKEGEMITSVTKKDTIFVVETEPGDVFETKTVLVATGSHRRKLTIPGAEKFENKGITYCASCDGPLFSDKDVVVVGGGNAGFETAAQLLAYVKSVTLLQMSDAFAADEITVNKVLEHKKMKAILNAETMEVKGNKFVKGIVYKDVKTGDMEEIKTDGIFVEIGQVPSTQFVKNLVETNKYGNVVTDPRTMRTSIEGIWAAGDCTDGLYHQNNIAAGDAVKALEDIYLYLNAH